METVEMDLMQAQIGSLATDVSRLEAKVSKGGGGGTLQIYTKMAGLTPIPIRATGTYGNFIELKIHNSEGRLFSNTACIVQSYQISNQTIGSNYTHYNVDMTSETKSSTELEEISDQWYIITDGLALALQTDGTFAPLNASANMLIDMHTGNVWIETA